MFTFREPTTVHTLEFRHRRQRLWEYSTLAPNAPTILAVHGFRGTHHGLARLVDALPGYRFLVPDLPGFGGSEALNCSHNLDAYTDLVAWCATEFGLGTPDVLLGHSFGSVVSAHAMATHPSLSFGALVLINPISEPALHSKNMLATRVAQFYYWLGAKLPEAAGMALLTNPAIVRFMSVALAKTRDPRLRAFIHHEHAQHFSDFANREVVLDVFTTSISHDVSEVAKDMTIPTLLIAGEKDELGTPQTQQALAESFPDATLRMITGVGHLVHYETPRVAAAIISDFLTRRASPLNT